MALTGEREGRKFMVTCTVVLQCLKGEEPQAASEGFHAKAKPLL